MLLSKASVLFYNLHITSRSFIATVFPLLEIHDRLNVSGHPNFALPSYFNCQSQWPRGLRHGLSSLVRTLGSWFRMPLKAWMTVCVYTVFVLSCVGSGFATCWSPVQEILPTVLGLRNSSETKRFIDALCSKVGATGKRERENDFNLFGESVIYTTINSIRP
jgi:hypothetical protein